MLVTHDLAEAYQIADVVVLYEGGRTIEATAKDDLLWKPSSERVARLIGARNILRGAAGRVLCTCEAPAQVLPMSDIETKSYLRMRVKDRPGVLGSIATIFGTEGVSIASVHQSATDGELAEIVWVTHKNEEKLLQSALDAISRLAIVEEVASSLRVED